MKGERRAVSLRLNPPQEVVLAMREAFEKLVRPCSSGCWEWTGVTITEDGAGTWLFNHGLKRYRVAAHRASLMLQGVTLDKDDIVFRSCRNLLCVNPEHLRVGDHSDNIASRDAAGNAVKGVDNGRAKLTESDVSQIKKSLASGSSRVALAQKYDVDRRAIWGIERGKTWKHVKAAK